MSINESPVMIALTGGRSTPVILCALATKPRAIEFINSSDEPNREDEIRLALSKMAGLQETLPGLSTPAYDINAIIDACQILMERHQHGPYIINLSSGTKVMALGAYEFAKSRGIPALYADTTGKRLIDVTTGMEQPLPKMNVEQYISCFGRSCHPKFMLDTLSVSMEQAQDIAEELVTFGVPAQEVLTYIRSNGKGGNEPRTLSIKNYTPTDEQQKVWQYLVDVGLLVSTEGQPNKFKFTIKQHGDYAFLEGAWLELYCWHQATHQFAENGETLFDGSAFNFEIPSNKHGARKEIDLGLIYAGQMLICSCKAGTNKIWSTEHLDELSAVSSLIGGRFCSRIFITSKLAPNKEERGTFAEYEKFLNQAKDREIVVIVGDGLASVGKLLAKEATKPTYWRV